jgi:hypothetical protein
MNILLGDFNAKVGREDIFKPTIWNESLHEICNDNGVTIVNFAASKNLIVRSNTSMRDKLVSWERHYPLSIWSHGILLFHFVKY